MSIHTMVINGLLHNPDVFAHQPVRSLTTEAFKANLSPNDAIPNRFHPHAQEHGPAHRKHLGQQHVHPLPCQPTTSTAAITIPTTSRSRRQWRPIRRISRALRKHNWASPCDNHSTSNRQIPTFSLWGWQRQRLSAPQTPTYVNASQQTTTGEHLHHHGQHQRNFSHFPSTWWWGRWTTGHPTQDKKAAGCCGEENPTHKTVSR